MSPKKPMKHAGPKQMVAQLAQQLGYEIVPAWRMRGLSCARHLSALFEQYRIDAVIDVGANTGHYHNFLRSEVGFDGPVLSYEPQPACFQQLSEKLGSDSAWQIRNLALGAEPGELAFNVMTDSQFSSFLPPNHEIVGDFGGMNCVKEIINVPVVRLDDEFASAAAPRGFSGRLHLKLDTQGFDLTVLRGATHTLARVATLQTELSIKPAYQGMPSYRQMIDELEIMGFELSSIFPISHDSDTMLIEADGVFVNRRVLLARNENE
ncbi:MAG TPA: FkbM family methyltransferase [Rhodocyclaceae bacterium]|nr:FkbM family methyltransferase [Rhodocyclaceae bacterium]